MEAGNEPNSFLVEEEGRVRLQKGSESKDFEEKTTWIPMEVEC
jgi:hypothetical protein